MSYLELLNRTREPFSNSPDPDAYYRTPTHEACLHRLEIAIRLRRGLNVVLGEVGTGKSTLCRCLLRALGGEERMDVFLLLDPGFEDADAFVRHLCELLTGQRPPEETARRDCVSLIQNRVFDRALNEGRNLVLFIDEGQKLAPAALEVLRELLNFETNTEKLLQIVIFGQPELAPIIEGMPNFKDRINEYLSLKPLSMRESVRLVRHRLRLAGGQAAERLFSLASLIALHRVSKGRPRQLMRLGHQMLLSLLVSNRRRVTAGMVRAQAARSGGGFRWGRWATALAALALALAFLSVPEATQHAFLARVEAALPALPGWFSAPPTPEGKGGQPHSDAALPASPLQRPSSQATEEASALRAEASAASTTPALRDVAPSTPDAASPVVGTLSTPRDGKPSSTARPAGDAEKAAQPPSADQRIAPPATQAHAASPSPARLAAPPLSDRSGSGNASSAVPLPETLGVFTVPAGASLADIARAVYGSASAQELVAAHNPAWRGNAGPDARTIELPAIVYAPPPSMTKGVLLSLGSHATAQEAYAAWLAYGKRSISVAIAPIWRPGEGLRFHILCPRSFTSERGAWGWISRFSPPADASPRLLPPFDESCLVFHQFTVK